MAPNNNSLIAINCVVDAMELAIYRLQRVGKAKAPKKLILEALIIVI